MWTVAKSGLCITDLCAKKQLNSIQIAHKMGKQKNATATARITINTSTEMAAYLDDLVSIGIQGKTRAEVAERLVSAAVQQLIKDGLLKLHK